VWCLGRLQDLQASMHIDATLRVSHHVCPFIRAGLGASGGLPPSGTAETDLVGIPIAP